MPAPTLPTLKLALTAPKGCGFIVLGLHGSDASPELVGVPAELDKSFAKKFGSSILDLVVSIGAQPAAGQCRMVPSLDGARLIIVGLGEGDPTPEGLRRAAGAGVREAAALAGTENAQVAISLGADEPETVRAIAEGALLGSYTYSPITSGEVPAPKIHSVTVLSTAAGQKGLVADGIQTARIVAQAVVTAREWINIPPNLLYPQTFAEEARQLVRDSRIAVEVLDDQALAKGGYGGLMAVGGGSSRLPRLVRFSYAPRGARFHLVLIGKGITFDSGGLNLKPGEGMYTMKCDMSGAAAVLAATKAIADLGLKIKVTCYASMAENLPSATSYRPSDVLTMYGGKTVENANCDAEGRLVMADALARAAEDNPDLVVDVATLTGACQVALGDRIGGVMATDDETAAQLLAAAEACGEEFWQLPIPDDYRGKLDSKVADVRSAGAGRAGGAMIAAAFLREFVNEPTPWAHLDIAGPAFHTDAPYGYVNHGGTGVGVRTLVSLASSLQG